MSSRAPHIAVRALILLDQRLLLVNAWPDYQSDLWCAPGGGVDPHRSLHDNLVREVHEETGLTVDVGAPALVNEFHDPKRSFHQIDIYFRCAITNGTLSDSWTDPEGIVTTRRFFSQNEMVDIRFKPDSLPQVAWDNGRAITYDPLELLIR